MVHVVGACTSLEYAVYVTSAAGAKQLAVQQQRPVISAWHDVPLDLQLRNDTGEHLVTVVNEIARGTTMKMQTSVRSQYSHFTRLV
jgi:hypothetical protein